MPQRPFRTLLVEGTHGAGKSTLIDALLRLHVQRSPARKIRTVLHLAQSHTYAPLAAGEDDGSLTVEQNLQHLNHIVSLLEWLERSVRDYKRAVCFVLIDTLHLTHCVRPGVVSAADVAAVDGRLAAIGCRLMFLRASEGTIALRAIDAAADSQFLTHYARKFGSTNEELHSYFVREQRTLEELAVHSAMEKRTFQCDGRLEEIAETAYDFWTSNESAAPACR